MSACHISYHQARKVSPDSWHGSLLGSHAISFYLLPKSFRLLPYRGDISAII